MPKNVGKDTTLKHTYELTFQDSKSLYIVIVSKTKKGKLRIKILDYSEFHLTYQSDFDYDELLKISKFFWLFKDIDSIIYEFDNLFLDEKVLLTMDLNHNIVLKFIIELNTRISFFLLRIENKDANKMKELGKIMALIEEQKGIIKELNKENRHLKKQMEKKGYKDDESESDNEQESKDKTVSSFVPQNGSLYEYNQTDRQLKQIFSFIDDPNDSRSIYDQHQILLLNIDESGTMDYVVYGYMNSGSHEGECGINLYHYDAIEDISTEQVFITSTSSYQILNANFSELLYETADNEFYIMVNGTLLYMSLNELTTKELMTGLDDAQYAVSGRFLPERYPYRKAGCQPP